MLPGNLIWSIIGFFLTVLVFSYLAGDNFLFRIIIYAFIGLSAAYVTLIVITQVIWPRLLLPIITGTLREQLIGVIGLIMCVLLSMKLIPRLARLGNMPMGYLVGVGASVAIGGALTGTLIPQALAMADINRLIPSAETTTFPLGLVLTGAMTLLGALTTLIYFQYSARQSRDGKVRRGFIIESLAWIGKVTVAISFGAIFAGVLSASITAMVERINFMISFLRMMGG
jgi:uncharacterized membrane protein YuzA (DUF378 family)